MKPTSRRELLSLGTAAGMTTFWDSRKIAQRADDHETPAHLVEDVKTFGAVGDALTDDTAAFQRAFDAAHKSGGGTVYAPPGRYLLKGSLTLPNGVSLRGSFSCVPSHNGIRDKGQPKPGEDGTALFATAGQGQEDGQPLVTLNTKSSVSSLTIYYPNQVLDGEPIPYPWAIAMRGKNPAAFDLELLNPYQGIDASHNERHNIRNITGQPLRRGIWVDAIYDIGRIENVHFNPWWNSRGAVYQWQTANGEAFIFGRSDWEYVLNTFCFGYRVGYKFVETSTGKCNGNFLGIGADDCNRAVLVEQSAPYGLLIANGEFTSFHGDDPTMVEVGASNKGVVRISTRSGGRAIKSLESMGKEPWASAIAPSCSGEKRGTAPQSRQTLEVSSFEGVNSVKSYGTSRWEKPSTAQSLPEIFSGVQRRSTMPPKMMCRSG